MGRESRQSRRQRQRREAERARKQTSNTSRNGLLAGVAMAIVVIGVVAALVFTQGSAQSKTAKATATAKAQAATQYTPVAGVRYGPIRCSYNEMVAAGFYHEHAHLTILDKGKDVPVSPQIGFDMQHDCLTWAHTHNPSLGIIHIESPYKIVPTLGEFFQIWNKPINTHQVASAVVKPGESMKVYVDGKPYSGDPANIMLVRHTDVTIEVGPPFQKPKPFNFAKYNL